MIQFSEGVALTVQHHGPHVCVRREETRSPRDATKQPPPQPAARPRATAIGWATSQRRAEQGHEKATEPYALSTVHGAGSGGVPYAGSKILQGGRSGARPPVARRWPCGDAPGPPPCRWPSAGAPADLAQLREGARAVRRTSGAPHAAGRRCLRRTRRRRCRADST